MRDVVISNQERTDADEEFEVMRQYFDLIHNQERIEYLVL